MFTSCMLSSAYLQEPGLGGVDIYSCVMGLMLVYGIGQILQQSSCSYPITKVSYAGNNGFGMTLCSKTWLF